MADKDSTHTNADLGLTIQSVICRKFGLIPNEQAKSQFEAGYSQKLAEELKPVVDRLFEELNLKPERCLTYSLSKLEGETLSPHNFLLNDGSTLSIRTNKNGNKVAPRVVGQCGIKTFNEHFEGIVGEKIEEKSQIKQIVFTKIHLMLPVFINYFFTSNYVIWFYKDKNYKYFVLDSSKYVELDFERGNFSFTKDLSVWNESTTLKYKGQSLAEIQVHKNRTFKFRFIMPALIGLLKDVNLTSETLGITAEKTVCDLFGLRYPGNFLKRYSPNLEQKLKPIILKAFLKLPIPVEYTGSEKGPRGGESKCPYDFVLSGNMLFSLKTNIGRMVCPPEVGQPSAKTCYLYFKNYVDEDHMNSDVYKRMVLEKIDLIFPIFVEHLFDSDYLLWIYKKNSGFDYKIFKFGFAYGIKWNKNLFTFSKPTVDQWNESNSLKYNGVSIGEFQVHKNRDCYKFRFNLENFYNLVEDMLK